MDTILPDNKQMVKNVIKGIDKLKEKSPDEKYDEMFKRMNNYNGWVKGLKPFIEQRIEMFRELTDINFTGEEDLREVGLKFLLSNLVRKELQDILNHVAIRNEEVTKKQKK